MYWLFIKQVLPIAADYSTFAIRHSKQYLTDQTVWHIPAVKTKRCPNVGLRCWASIKPALALHPAFAGIAALSRRHVFEMVKSRVGHPPQASSRIKPPERTSRQMQSATGGSVAEVTVMKLMGTQDPVSVQRRASAPGACPTLNRNRVFSWQDAARMQQ